MCVLAYADTLTVPVTRVNRAYGLCERAYGVCNRIGGYGMDDAGVARRIALARLGRGWTQRELGAKLGKTKASATMLETGRGISSDMLAEVARVLKVSYGFLAAGMASEADIDVIVEGARQNGWDQAVARMRLALKHLNHPPARPMRSDEAPDVVPHPATKRKRGA
jgi:transcriptional regulator with XRE-family HTH domain